MCNLLHINYTSNITQKLKKLFDISLLISLLISTELESSAVKFLKYLIC